MKKFLVALNIVICATVAVEAQAKQTLTDNQKIWLKVYNDSIEQTAFAIKVQDNDNICYSMNVAKEAALRIKDEEFYKNHIKLMKDLARRGALCYGWDSL